MECDANDLRLYEALLKRRKNHELMTQKVFAELREWWELRDRAWAVELSTMFAKATHHSK